MDLYHADIRLPDGYRLPTRKVALRWSNHALRARNNDRYGVIPRWNVLNLHDCQTIEVGIENRRVAKIVLRTRLDDERDVVYVVIPGEHLWFVKTVWVNLRSDTHGTLDRSRYVN